VEKSLIETVVVKGGAGTGVTTVAKGLDVVVVVVVRPMV